MTLKGDRHILGTGTLQGERGIVIADSSRSKRDCNVISVDGINSADGCRIDSEHPIGIIDCQVHIACQSLANDIESHGGAIVHHDVAKVDFVR